MEDNKTEKRIEERLEFMIEKRMAEGNEIRKLKQQLLDDPRDFEAILQLLKVGQGLLQDVQL